MTITDRKRYVWEELAEQYPDKWVVVEDAEMEQGGIRSGVLLGVCSDNEIDDFIIDCYDRGLIIRYERTTEGRSFTKSESLLWKEIQAKHPDQWVALEDVKYMNDNGCNVVSAVVVCAMSDDEYISCRLKFMRDGKDYKYERTEDISGWIGVTI